MTDDNVNHPGHYNQYIGFEVIDVCEQLVGPDGKSGFNLGNAFKYIARAGWKNPDKHVEDLKKAIFYIQREIDRIENPDWYQVETKVHRCPVSTCKLRLIPTTTINNSSIQYICGYGHGGLEVNPDGSTSWNTAPWSNKGTINDMADVAFRAAGIIKDGGFDVPR